MREYASQARLASHAHFETWFVDFTLPHSQVDMSCDYQVGARVFKSQCGLAIL